MAVTMNGGDINGLGVTGHEAAVKTVKDAGNTEHKTTLNGMLNGNGRNEGSNGRSGGRNLATLGLMGFHNELLTGSNSGDATLLKDKDPLV